MADNSAWVAVRSLEDFAALRSGRSGSPAHWWPDIGPTGDDGSFAFTHRIRRLGPITVLDIDFHNDMWVNGGEVRPHYHVTVPVTTPADATAGGFSVAAKPGSVCVYRPEGKAGISGYGGRLLAVMIDRRAVEDALAGALGRSIASQIDCQPIMATTAPAARSWINMVTLFTEQLFEPGSPLQQPMVGLPFAESVVHGLLLATDHSYRAALDADAPEPEPPAVRAALDVIEAEADQPLTVSVLAERSYVSVRSLQQAFRHHLGITPMAYLRDVRLRRAHQMLLESDPARITVASVAYRWGFTNLGRFAAVHSARYRESPSETLRRSA
ncbi:AraC family transcriptional regulator [Mycobacterium triplex]|nr:AraC family transcriptional regulator [Mycobacterium triplex]